MHGICTSKQSSNPFFVVVGKLVFGLQKLLTADDKKNKPQNRDTSNDSDNHCRIITAFIETSNN